MSRGHGRGWPGEEGYGAGDVLRFRTITLVTSISYLNSELLIGRFVGRDVGRFAGSFFLVGAARHSLTLASRQMRLTAFVLRAALFPVFVFFAFGARD